MKTWLLFALGSAFFAIFAVTAALVSFRKEWVAPASLAAKPVMFLVLSGIATGLSWPRSTS
ncbi:MAG TPA: hypothetical protein VEU32_21735 [Burkholderiales bacterium]|nr:hypothetical protein [Burkholderiales bacterium]